MSKQESANDFAEYRYNSSAGQWVELPFDQPANDFIGKLLKAGKLNKKLSPQQAEEVLERIKTNDCAKIHKHIYHNKIRPREQAGTRPFSFFWEVHDLLEAIFIAHCRQPKAVGEELSKAAFSVLAEIMARKNVEDTVEYPTAIILSDTEVQRAMMRHFGTDIEKRMELVKKLAYKEPSANPGKVTSNVLEAVEHRIVHLSAKPNELDDEFEIVVNTETKTSHIVVAAKNINKIIAIIQNRMPMCTVSTEVQKADDLIVNHVRTQLGALPERHYIMVTGFHKIGGQWVFAHDGAKPPADNIVFATKKTIPVNRNMLPKGAFQAIMDFLSISVVHSMMEQNKHGKQTAENSKNRACALHARSCRQMSYFSKKL